VFARQGLFRHFGKSSQQFRDYYHRHPEWFAYDEAISKRPALGALNPHDSSIFQTQFALIDELGRENMVSGPPSARRVNWNENNASRKIKGAALQFGADISGIGLLNRQWVYSHVGCTGGNREGYLKWGTSIDLNTHTHVIALGFRMDLALLAHAPEFPALLATSRAYTRSAVAAVCLADYIRRMGYQARAHHFSNYQVLAVPIAADCGLGELSRAGFLLTPPFGLGVRLSIVTTDMPMRLDPPADFGVQSFCHRCLRCARSCPSGAIPAGEKILHNGTLKWKLDEQKCYAYWHVHGTDCGICMAVCPWTKPQTAFHQFCARLASINGPHQRWMAWADNWIYGRRKSRRWPDYLEEDQEPAANL
jgi:ferredoxin